MLNINNNMTKLKSQIMVELTKLQLTGRLSEESTAGEIEAIAERIAKETPQDKKVIRERMIADLGFSVEGADLDRPLAEFVKEAYERKTPSWPVFTMIQEACNACEKSHHFVTDACQACLARPCQVNCPKQAITVTDRARIDPSKCINCSLCAQNCPYHAIIKTTVPCEDACPVGAITKEADGREKIDFDKCIFCGKCMANCPFGAMVQKSQLFDVVKHMMNGKHIAALYAPAVGAQYKGLKPGQFDGALLEAGFTKVLEVGIGADVTADNEAREFEERMERGDKIMTTSCCPAYVRAVKVHIPELADCVSETFSPMIYTAQIAKKADPECITVFIGPCLAKRREGYDSELVDYVLSVDEVNALFLAKGIDPAKSASVPGKYTPTVSGRNFAKTGGVAESVRLRLKDKSILKPLVINGLNKAEVKILSNYGKIAKGLVPAPDGCPNLIEVMACEGGCIAGPGVITNPKLGAGLLTLYANAGSKPGEDGIPLKADVEKIIEAEK